MGLENPLDDYNTNNYKKAVEKSCRIYPEKDAPFVWTENNNLVDKVEGADFHYAVRKYALIKSPDSKFASTNICQPVAEIIGTDGEGSFSILDPGLDCDCSYTKASYGSENLFFPYDYDKIPDEIVNPYSYEGEYATDLRLDSKINYLGWKGFCLDYDHSLLTTSISGHSNLIEDPEKLKNRCLLWYPIDMVSGEMDSFLVDNEAELSAPENSNMCM